MVIRASSSREVARLVADLTGDSALAREAAIARLAVVGDRAMPRLLLLLSGDVPPESRAGALRALEAIGHPRSLAPALTLIDDPAPAVVAAAIGVARVHLTSRDPGTAAAALDRLTAIALDPTRADRTRELALDALRDLPAHDVQPILTRLRDDRSERLRARATAAVPGAEQPPGGRRASARSLTDAEFPNEPGDIKALLQTEGPTSPIGTLHKLIEALRERERAERSAARRAEWAVVRAAVHQVLAARGSRVGLYDVRETLEAADGPIAVGFLAAAGAVGDPSCLAPLAACYARSTRSRHDSWRRQVAVAFREIVTREKVTKRHASLKQVIARWPEAAKELLE